MCVLSCSFESQFLEKSFTMVIKINFKYGICEQCLSVLSEGLGNENSVTLKGAFAKVGIQTNRLWDNYPLVNHFLILINTLILILILTLPLILKYLLKFFKRGTII